MHIVRALKKTSAERRVPPRDSDPRGGRLGRAPRCTWCVGLEFHAQSAEETRVSPGTSFSWVPNRNGITSAPCRTCNQLTPTCGCLTHCPFLTFNSGEAHLTRKLCSTVTSLIDCSRYLYVLSFSTP
ncbi:unnamed protein product [Musa acuminata subsp. malaccensis]|uniref:(wild Malaysian banana) hypothetical protein n=1 Tax=Musa acuminata subsp. malaccensis TaxID=214687 RepID=A0A804KPD8_MUSAM|nr:unnamed protein product [Musa acuminata subsp. malaccensis]